MDQTSQPISSEATSRMRAAAFSVHIFTAIGAGVALIAMLEAVREHWTNMFGWLGVALIIDAIDGPIAIGGENQPPAPLASSEDALREPAHHLEALRVVRLRWLTLWLVAAWAALALAVLANDFNVGVPVVAALCAIAAYIVGSHAAIRLIKSFKA